MKNSSKFGPGDVTEIGVRLIGIALKLCFQIIFSFIRMFESLNVQTEKIFAVVAEFFLLLILELSLLSSLSLF